MGNTPPAPSKGEEAPSPPPADDDGYNWPDNLYIESRDMAAMASFAYTFAYILDADRKEAPDGLVGLNIDAEGHLKKKDSPFELERSFTPSEVKTLIQDNEAKLDRHFPRKFTGAKLDKLLSTLDQLDERARSSASASAEGESGTLESSRPLTLEEYDDKHQHEEMVYAVCKDSVQKRITLVFRGSEGKLGAFKTNWLTNVCVLKKGVAVPEAVKGKVSSETMWFHSGFYNYVFDKTAKTTDAEEKTKYDEILEDVKFLLKKYPDYKLYVTGHSLGGALSSMVSFFLSCEDDSIPKPVTCVNFAAPRIGDCHFLEAVQALEEEGKLRYVRVANENDTIAVIPCYGYVHAGIQTRLYESPAYDPVITYPKKVDSWQNRLGRTWGNSVFASLNLGYDHDVGSYQERLEKDQKQLENYNVNQLYANEGWTGQACKGFT